MSYKTYDQIAFGLDVVEIIDVKVQSLAQDYWNDDECPPEFWVSLNNEDPDNQSIMITVNHLDHKFTERLFPRQRTEYGYGSVIDQMINMYNRTM